MSGGVRVAVPTDVDTVFRRMSRQTRAEFKAAGLRFKDQKREIRKRVADGKAFTYDPGTPAMVFGFNEFDDYFSMWTVASQVFFDAGSAGVRVSRRFFRGLDLGKPVIVVTESPHPDTDRWLRLLGFQIDSAAGDRRVFTLIK